MKGLITFLIVVLCIALVIAVLVGYVKRKMRNFSRDIFGTDSLMEGWKRQEKCPSQFTWLFWIDRDYFDALACEHSFVEAVYGTHSLLYRCR